MLYIELEEGYIYKDSVVGKSGSGVRRMKAIGRGGGGSRGTCMWV